MKAGLWTIVTSGALGLSLGALGTVVLFSPESLQAAAKHEPPYWASIAARSALLRTGPGTNFPARWRYVRTGMPLRVVQMYQDWRRVRDPDGTEGWMRSNLLSDQRTGMVTGETRPLYTAPGGSEVVARAEAGVIGRISRCESGWCRFETHGRTGYIEEGGLWGVDPDETFDH